MENTTTTENPIIANLSTEDLVKALENRNLKVAVKPVTVKEKAVVVELTPEQHLLAALEKIVGVVDGKIEVIPAEDRPEGTDAHTYFDNLSLKARTTAEKIAAAKRPKYEGAKRGPKGKNETAPETQPETAPETQNGDSQPESGNTPETQPEGQQG